MIGAYHIKLLPSAYWLTVAIILNTASRSCHYRVVTTVADKS